MSRKRSDDLAEHHVLGDLRHLRNDVDDVVAVTSQRRPISAFTAAVSSQPITLSGSCRCRM